MKQFRKIQQRKLTEEVEVGKRLALVNMDWESVSANDLFALFRSLCLQSDISAQNLQLKKVSIYPSKYGTEQMAKDSIYGPPKAVLQTD